MQIPKTAKVAPPGHQSRSLSGGFHCKEAPAHRLSDCDQHSNQPGFVIVFDFQLRTGCGNIPKFTFSGCPAHLGYVFGGDLKVQFAIDVDFPEILISSRLSWIWFAGPFSLFAG